jgi:hypothetical protein
MNIFKRSKSKNNFSKSSSGLEQNTGNEDFNDDSIHDDVEINYYDEQNQNNNSSIYNHYNNFTSSKSFKSPSVWSCDWNMHNLPQMHIKYVEFYKLYL